MRKLLITLLVLFGSPVTAGDVSRIEVTFKDGEYRVEVEAVLKGEPDAVFDILTDYGSWPQLSGIIMESTPNENDFGSRRRVRTVSRGCVLAFCKTVEQVQWVEVGPDWEMTAVVVPEESDLRSGYARTRLEQGDGATKFYYEMTLVPDFWVPPIIGPMIIRHKLRREAIETARLIEVRTSNGR